ncbi:hypothetical protein, partial [Stenotrophomonas sp. BIGb0135]|uniref:hypothetical protein n=1 Tax=Stenotrophomonas sp. BIGb0135 TaxID=2940620 RepID=UPI0021681797
MCRSKNAAFAGGIFLFSSVAGAGTKRAVHPFGRGSRWAGRWAPMPFPANVPRPLRGLLLYFASKGMGAQ